MSFAKLTIRRVKIEELGKLLEISRDTFMATYQAHNSAENMQHYLTKHFNKGRLEKELTNSKIHFYFAEWNEEIIGYARINQGDAQTELRFQNSLEIERIYILASYQGQGFGRSLLNKIIEVAKETTLTKIWLAVWDQNKKAISFYERNGFYKAGMIKFMLGNDPQNDHIMKFNLS